MHKRRLLRYGNDEKRYEFDRKLRLLNLEFLEILELNFKKNFLDFLEYDDFHYSDNELYYEKFLDNTLKLILKKEKNFKSNDKEVRLYLKENEIISNYIFIDKLTFGEVFKLFRNLKIKNKKKISKNYNLNVYVFENWIYASKYIRNVCSHYFNLYNIKGIIGIEDNKLINKAGVNNSYLVYFFIFSIFEKNITGLNIWQDKVIALILSFGINIYDINLNQKNNLPSELESEAWKVLVNELYGFYVKKSNKSNKKGFKNMNFSIILAVDDKSGLGKDNDLVWRISSDLKYFKKITTSGRENVVIMGRKTWNSIPEKYKPLPGRINCILSKNISEYKNTDNIKYFDNFNKCLNSFNNKENIFIIGGANLYNQVLDNPMLDKIYLTKVKGDYNCDVFFDGVPDTFQVESYTDTKEESGIEYSFWVYKKTD